MKLLSREQLRAAEGVLRQHLPRSYKLYGYLHGMNRNKPAPLEVLVDAWPDFKVILTRPDAKRDQELTHPVTCFSTNELALRNVLAEENVADWSTCFAIGGVENSHTSLLKEISCDWEINSRCFTTLRLLYLPEVSFLQSPAIDSELESRISSLNLSHAELVNQTWKFGGNQQGSLQIKNLISNFPSCCIMDGQGQPVSWILVYDYGAMGVLYTLPEHRGKGYAKVLISTMVKKLFAENRLVYCCVEEENTLSYRLFKNLGFIEDPTYRVVWLELDS